MKKLLGLMAVAPMALAACGEAEANHEHVLNNGIYHVEADGFKEEIKLSVKVSDQKVHSIELISENDTPGRWDESWSELESQLVGLNADDLAHFTADSKDITDATGTTNGIVKAVQKVVDNEDNLVSFGELYDYSEIIADLGEIVQDVYGINHYYETVDTEEGESSLDDADHDTTEQVRKTCPIVDSSFSTPLANPADDAEIARMFMADNSMIISMENMPGMGMTWFHNSGFTQLTYDELHTDAGSIKLGVYDSSTLVDDEDACPSA